MYITALLVQRTYYLIFKIAIISLTLLLPTEMIAQEPHACGNELIQLKEQRKTIPPSLSSTKDIKNQPPLYLKTVVHIQYYNDYDSIPSEEIDVLIEDLNRVFRGEGVDSSLVNPLHLDKLMDSNIQFCLAKSDPEGNPTTGITYKKTQSEYFITDFFWGDSIDLEELKMDSLGGVSPWDIDRYFNIWIADMALDVGGPGGQLILDANHNYAVPLPGAFPLNTLFPDYPIPGIVIDLSNFIYETPFFSLENLVAHECGHYLGLVHTFNGGFNGDCDNSNDFIEDTPTCFPNDTCGVEINSCLDSINDLPDHSSNAMDYACMQMFTPDQISMMHHNLSQASPGLYDEFPCGIASSIEENQSADELNFEVLPNPNSGEFIVKFKQPILSKGKLFLFNSFGKKIFDKDITNDDPQSIMINSFVLPKGIYILTYKSTQGTFSKKVLIH